LFLTHGKKAVWRFEMSSISEVIAKALDTPEGRKRLAKAMAVPMSEEERQRRVRKRGCVEIYEEDVTC